jgi:hypothetical protein
MRSSIAELTALIGLASLPPVTLSRPPATAVTLLAPIAPAFSAMPTARSLAWAVRGAAAAAAAPASSPARFLIGPTAAAACVAIPVTFLVGFLPLDPALSTTSADVVRSFVHQSTTPRAGTLDA